MMAMAICCKVLGQAVLYLRGDFIKVYRGRRSRDRFEGTRKGNLKRTLKENS